jgi:hypothetical protein
MAGILATLAVLVAGFPFGQASGGFDAAPDARGIGLAFARTTVGSLRA